MNDERAETPESPEGSERAVGGGDEARAERDIVSRSDLSLLVLLRDQVQKPRIAEGNRAAASERLAVLATKAEELRAEGIDGEELVAALMKIKVDKTPTSELVARHIVESPQNVEREMARAELHRGYEERLKGIEGEIERSVRPFMRAHPAWPWLSQIRGVAETSAALVVGYIDIEKADTVSALWRYAGFAVIDGRSERPKAGQKNSYNSRLRTMVWRLISNQIRLGGPYEQEYRNAKHTYLTTRGPDSGYVETNRPEADKRYGKPWDLGHCEAAARRRAGKLFLSHLWEVWREAEGLPVRPPFIGTVPGHDMIDPWSYVGADRPGQVAS